MQSGDTFLFEDGRDDHLWMVISDTAQDPEHLVVVRFLSWQEYYDQACVLDAGDHPFIKHPTCVDFPSAAFASNALLESLRVEGKIKVRQPLPTLTLEKIRAATLDSDIRQKFVLFLGQQKLVDYQ